MPEYYTQSFSDLRLDGMSAPEEKDACIPRFHLEERVRGDQLEQVEMVEVIVPGDRLSRPIFKVTDEHRKRWPRQYQAFKSGIELNMPGTPIAAWQALSWSAQNEIRALGFQTIEQLANAHDGQIGSMNNGSVWRAKARAYVKEQDSQKQALETRDDEIAELKARLKKLEIANVPAQPGPSDGRRKPGRPKRIASPDQAGHESGRAENGIPVASVSGQAPARNAA